MTSATATLWRRHLAQFRQSDPGGRRFEAAWRSALEAHPAPVSDTDPHGEDHWTDETLAWVRTRFLAGYKRLAVGEGSLVAALVEREGEPGRRDADLVIA